MTAGFDELSATLPRNDPAHAQAASARDGAAPGRRRGTSQDWMLFQPRLSLQGGRLRAVEAATRMPPAQAGRTAGGLGGTGQDATQGGRAARLAAWRLETAASEIATWRDTGARLCVAVPAELHPDTLLSLLGELGGEGSWEHLELACTEGWLWALDGDGVMAMAAISDLGVAFAVEDFGESSASLSLLRRLPLGVARLHASMVRDLERGAEDRAVLRAIVGAAHAIGLRVAATGVDTLRQCDTLREIGCDEGVGTALSPPLSSRQLSRWLGGARRAGGGDAAGEAGEPRGPSEARRRGRAGPVTTA